MLFSWKINNCGDLPQCLQIYCILILISDELKIKCNGYEGEECIESDWKRKLFKLAFHFIYT